MINSFYVCGNLCANWKIALFLWFVVRCSLFVSFIFNSEQFQFVDRLTLIWFRFCSLFCWVFIEFHYLILIAIYKYLYFTFDIFIIWIVLLYFLSLSDRLINRNCLNLLNISCIDDIPPSKIDSFFHHHIIIFCLLWLVFRDWTKFGTC